ncbi:TIGR04222 domain-containing membrane protein [Streptomyces venezuelae]|uniref:TIGR04222 domain-containing membrane protein n=1 Tax=Streptomyces venezuelae TaxID=54571 RepID=A0A5P2CYT5_STRVZ|nr:TIGR04222 domain-containing membrane protein [Streptomyces venezuelae]QES47623.1 TIGR04222 domain-containing membrane protein [Streptomyces venezuelae]
MFWVLFLLVACAGVLAAGARLLRAVAEAADIPEADVPEADVPEADVPEAGVTLYEAAYLAGGPHRVAVLTLVSMERERRLLLAHTGWATVVDPVGRDPLERSVLGAFGPEGRSPVAAVRTAAARGEAVRRLGERLRAAGLALPEGVRAGFGHGLQAVRGAVLLVVAMATAAVTLDGGTTDTTLVLCWFGLPLLPALALLALARLDASRHSPWASPAGLRLLSGLRAGDRGPLTSVALHGVAAVGDPGLRAALSCGGRGILPRQRGR